MLTHFSLFSGIGGIDLAAEWAGFTTVGQVEWADYPTKVLEKHWPDVPRWRDIRSVTAEDFYNRTGLRTVDLISGGFPCQPFSVAGKQKGKRDDRYLWPEMFRVIREIKPTWVLGENVPGILSIAGKTVCEDLEREGYAVTVFNFEAAAVGAPHRRDRVFFVANRQDGNEQEQQKCDNREEHKRRTQVRYGLGAGRGSKDGDSSERVEIGSGVTTEVSEDVADTDSEGLQGRANARKERREREKPANEQPGRCSPCQNHWSAEPDVGRVANGIPNRVDRLKCLGNAVVPQQVYPILQAIAEIETP
jgi:DNA (cytosine-5)-methyltransferase 1